MVENIKDLEKLLKLLRKQGVTEFNHSGLSLKLGDLPQTVQPQHEEPTEQDLYSQLPTNPTPEQLMFYSSNTGDDQ